MRLVHSFFSPYEETEIKKVSQEALDNLASMLKEIFFFSLTWSIGTTTNLAGREKFDKWCRERIIKSSMPFPEDKLVYDF